MEEQPRGRHLRMPAGRFNVGGSLIQLVVTHKERSKSFSGVKMIENIFLYPKIIRGRKLTPAPYPFSVCERS